MDVSTACQYISCVHRYDFSVRAEFCHNLLCTQVAFFVLSAKYRHDYRIVGKIKVYIGGGEPFSDFPDIFTFLKFVSFEFFFGDTDRNIRNWKFVDDQLSGLLRPAPNLDNQNSLSTSHTADHSGYWSMQAQLHLVLEMHRHCPHARWSHPDRSRVAAINFLHAR